MKFSEETNDKLKRLILFSMDKEVDDEYIQLFIEIINDDQNWPKKVTLKKDNKQKIMNTNSALTNWDIIYNLEFMKKFYSKSYSKLDKDFVPQLTYFYSYCFSFVLMHELNHLYQKLCARDSIDKYQEVNNLYKLLYDSISNFRKFDLLKYGLLHDKYCLERNANIKSANFLAEVFEGTELDQYSKVFQMNQLFANGYHIKKGKVVSPVEKTLNYLEIKEDFDTSGLPFAVLFEHGFKITDNDFHFLYDQFLYSGGIVNYEETISKIKILNKKVATNI